jgi:hypothetical protein
LVLDRTASLIDFRYHVVSLVAVFLALALGLFLGSTTLQSTVTHNLSRQAKDVTNRNRALEATNSQLSAELKGERALTAAVEPYAVDNRLTGGTVALISAPGVDADVRKAVSATIQFAGATITSDVQLQPSYVDPIQDAELGVLASELALPGRTLPAGNGVTQVSAELADVLLVRPAHHAVPRARVEAALSALADGKFINFTASSPQRPATVAVFLLASPSTSVTPALAQTQNTDLLGLAADLRAASSGTVIAGPAPVQGTTGGTINAVLSDSALTNVMSVVSLDSNDPAAGRIAIVLALAAAPSGSVGEYGLSGKHSHPLPSASPSP